MLDLFKQNKYSKWYFDIIKKYQMQEKDPSVYMENHHIVPRCLGGVDDQSNMVFLPPKAHLVCHWLLTKMSDDHRIKFAAFRMAHINPRQAGRYKVSARVYESLKLLNVDASRVRNGQREYDRGWKVYHDVNTWQEFRIHEGELVRPTLQVGRSPGQRIAVGNSNRNKTYFHNPLTNQTISLNTGKEIPKGYIKGNPKSFESCRENVKGSIYYYNPETGEEKRCKECPIGWHKGRSVLWFTDGQSNTQINFITGIIPNNWKKGRTISWKIFKKPDQLRL